MPRPRRAAKTAGALVGDVEARRLVFVDGAFVPELSDTAALGARACGRLARRCARRRRSGADGASRQARAGKRCRRRAQHRADGRRRRDPHRRRLRPSSGRCISSSSPRQSRPRPSCARWSWSSRARAAMLIESHEGPAGSDYQVNAALELFVGDDAHVDHVKIIGEGADALHVSTLARRDRRQGALQRLHLHRRRRRGAQPAVPEFRRRGHRRRHPRRDPDQGPPARRHDARRQPYRARLPEPRGVQGGARRRGPRRVPGPHHRAAAARRRPTPR